MSEYPSQEQKFIHNYMVIREMEEAGRQKRVLAEEMRHSKEVWIDIYPKSGDSATDLAEIQRLGQIAGEIKKINVGQVAPIYDFIHENEVYYVVTEPPKGRPFSRWSRSDENTLKAIATETVRLFQWLQNHNFGINHLSPHEVYFTAQTQSVQLLFNDGLCIRASRESREKEIRIIGELFYFLITGEMWIEGSDVEKKVEELGPKGWGDLISKMISDEEGKQIKRLEVLFPLMRANGMEAKNMEAKNMEDPTMKMLAQEETTTYKQTVRLFFILLGTVFFYFGFVQTKGDRLQDISTLDVTRFQVMGYFGAENAQQALGEIYEKGYGVGIDLQQSMYWYKKAAQSGNIFAQMSLGRFYDRGIGVDSDQKQALYWFTLAAANGDKTAQRNIEIIHENERILSAPSDTEESVETKPEVASQPPVPSENTPKKEMSIAQTERFQPILAAPYANKPVITQAPYREPKKSSQTNIMWQDNEDVIRVKRSWNGAMHYCETLYLNGYSDWTLPDKELLFDLFFEQADLQYVANDLYWTSSEASHNSAWRIYFDYSGGKNRQGNMSSNSKSDEWYIRCYRKIQ
ncbi:MULTISPECIES: tetratricopeptide repeat protein [unclassified Sulfuricurvum]|uniref:tetratricopeptide repeat protein n=1 Tax=unclassified Sulfuricurvum TaxID=2632390 RepID=UPI0002996F29|nr:MULTISPECIES: tetratricopeptide repeat protein [unclassified Sulfuricurvum]AFV97224.1 hypothetical protein B649_04550 [Candidatus Sulfuricurvum sp. RIFRC-1]OHD88774.1 MAG: hypothetical protein A3G19_09360 [Sulfuricurvum sp. RIFCSPLOWO2_12_FULL_43_24]HBM34874.1 DUF1566 domain-containing protein [Sulfuricurvum sp.]